MTNAVFDLSVGSAVDLVVRRLWRIIDDCEHILATAAALMERMSGAVPDAIIIATRREPMRTRHQQVSHLSGLAFPDSVQIIEPDEAMRYPAVQLFLAKAGHRDAADVDTAWRGPGSTRRGV